jgi:hypothetical protein
MYRIRIYGSLNYLLCVTSYAVVLYKLLTSSSGHATPIPSSKREWAMLQYVVVWHWLSRAVLKHCTSILIEEEWMD